MSSMILFTDDDGGVLSTILCKSDDSARGELIKVAARYFRSGWLLDAASNGGYAATPPPKSRGILSAVCLIALRRGI